MSEGARTAAGGCLSDSIGARFAPPCEYFSLDNTRCWQPSQFFAMSCFGGGSLVASKRRAHCSSALIKVCSALPDEDSDSESDTSDRVYQLDLESNYSSDATRTPRGTISGSDGLDIASSQDSEEAKAMPSTIASLTLSPAHNPTPRYSEETPPPPRGYQLTPHVATSPAAAHLEAPGTSPVVASS